MEVSELKGTPQISNLDALLSQIDTVARDDNHSNSFVKYTISRQENYFIGTNVNSSWSSYTNDNSDEFSIVSIYKIDSQMSGSTSTSYKIYGYSNLVLNNNQVNVSSLKSKDQYSDYNSFDSAQECHFSF